MSDHAEMIDRLAADGEGAGPPPLPASRAARWGVGCVSGLIVLEHFCLGFVFALRGWSLLLCSGGSSADPCPNFMMVEVRPGAVRWWWAALVLIAGCLVAAARGRSRRRWLLWLGAVILPIAWFAFANAVFVRPLH